MFRVSCNVMQSTATSLYYSPIAAHPMSEYYYDVFKRNRCAEEDCVLGPLLQLLLGGERGVRRIWISHLPSCHLSPAEISSPTSSIAHFFVLTLPYNRTRRAFQPAMPFLALVISRPRNSPRTGQTSPSY